MARIGLYYPYSHFKTMPWLLASALYWPRLARIVPPGFPLRDSPGVRELVDELDLIVDIDPSPGAAALTKPLLELFGEYGESIAARHGVRQLMEDGTTPSFRTVPGDYHYNITSYKQLEHRFMYENGEFEPPEWPTQKPSPWSLYDTYDRRHRIRLAPIHVSRVDERVRDVLCDLGLAVWPAFGPGEESKLWLGAVDPVASLLTCALVVELANRNGLVPVTEQQEGHTLARGWSVDQVAAAFLDADDDLSSSPTEESRQAVVDPGTETVLAMLALNLVVPRELRAADVIGIRARYGADFLAFGDEIERFAQEIGSQLADVRDSAAFAAHLAYEVERRFAQPLTALRKQVCGMGLSAGNLALNVKLEAPAAMASVAGGAWVAGYPVVAGSAAAAAGLITLRNQIGERTKATFAPSSVTYLFHTAEYVGRTGGDIRSRLKRALYRAQRLSGMRS